MKTVAYCWSCGKAHDISNLNSTDYGIKCKCGGFVISPSGKINMRLVPENEEDRKLFNLGVEKAASEEIDKPMPKVFRMDDYSWVCAMNEDDAIAWYIEQTGVTEDDLDVRECDIDEVTMWSEISLSDITKKLEQMDNYDETNLYITRKYGDFIIQESFREVIESMIEQSD